MNFTKRQIEIIKSATSLIGKKGIQNLTTKNLAKKMSFTEPALYRHFKNKTDILKSVLLYYKSELNNKISIIINSKITGKEKLKSIMNFQFNHFNKTPAIIMVIFSETSFQYNNILSKTVSEIMHSKKDMIETIIKNGQIEKNIRNDIKASQLTNILMGSMRLTILRWRLSNFETDLEKEGKLLWSTMEKLIKKQ